MKYIYIKSDGCGVEPLQIYIVFVENISLDN